MEAGPKSRGRLKRAKKRDEVIAPPTSEEAGRGPPGSTKKMKKPISGKTKIFAVLGHPIGHTLSPVMHNAALEAMDYDGVYLALDVAPEDLMLALEGMNAMHFGGVNVTIPLKQVAFENLEQLDESAELLGAVNTVAFIDGTMKGYNTDGYGLLRALKEDLDLNVNGRRVFVLGAGGAGRAAALVCAREGAASVTVCDCDEYRAENVAQEIHHRQAGATVEVAVDPAARDAGARAADLIVQATPIGMKPADESPLAPGVFRPGQAVFDLIYMYPATACMRAAEAAGARTANGLSMLLHQGARALEIWTGREAPADVMRDALRKAVYKR